MREIGDTMLRILLCVVLLAGLMALAQVKGFTSARQQSSSRDHGDPARSLVVPNSERRALVAFYKATHGERWTRHDGWLGPRGTECSWYGIDCVQKIEKTGNVGFVRLYGNNLVGTIPQELGLLTKLEWLDLGENHLTGSIPIDLAQLHDLNVLYLRGNQFAGIVPRELVWKWLNGHLDLNAEAHLLTDISQIDFQSSAPALLCARDRYILSDDGHVISYSVRCRNATPNDRATYCEVRQGQILDWDFATLSWIIEKNGFFDFSPKYYRNITHNEFFDMRVTRGGKTHAVSDYAEGGPFELKVIEFALMGAERSVEWEKTSTQEKCPHW